MKISHRKITAATEVAKIPSPLDQVYDIASDAEVEEMTGYPGDEYTCEEIDGYDVKHLAWAVAKPEYEDALANQGIDIVELVQEGTDVFLGYVVHDRLYAVEESDLESAGIDL